MARVAPTEFAGSMLSVSSGVGLRDKAANPTYAAPQQRRPAEGKSFLRERLAPPGAWDAHEKRNRLKVGFTPESPGKAPENGLKIRSSACSTSRERGFANRFLSKHV